MDDVDLSEKQSVCMCLYDWKQSVSVIALKSYLLNEIISMITIILFEL